jgi:hypothetical protein
MATKKKERSTAKGTKLKLNKETVKDLSDNQSEKVRGGAQNVRLSLILCPSIVCPPTKLP